MSFLITLLGLFVAIILSNLLSNKWPKVPLALFQIGIGVILSLSPVPTELDFDPEIFMICIIAPLLFSEGNHISRREFWNLKSPILLLAFGLVFFTVFAGGYLIHILIPEMPMAVAFALAAIITPTDNVAVKSITNGLKLPGNIMPILEGESLLNDAAGIVAFKMALAAALTGVFSIKEASLNFLFVSLGGLLLGLLLGYLIVKFRLAIRNLGLEEITMMIVIQFITPFFIYFLAEEIGVSGILAVVAAGIIHGIEKDRLQRTTTKLQFINDHFWSVVSFVLNGLVFTLLGFMLPSVYTGLKRDPEITMGVIIGITFLIAIGLFILRYLWVYMLHGIFIKERKPPLELFFINLSQVAVDYDEGSEPVSRGRYAFVTAISGIHGTISLATALSIPFILPNGHEFPMRNIVMFIVAGVILISLLAATLILPLLAVKENTVKGKYLDTDDAFKTMIKATINQLASETKDGSNMAVQQVIRELHQKMIDMESGPAKAPDQKIIKELTFEASEKELEIVKNLVEDGRISASVLKIYTVYLTKTTQFLQKSPMRKLKSIFLLWVFKRRINRKWKKGYETKVKNTLNKYSEEIRSIRFAQIMAARGAVSFIKKKMTDENRQEAILVMQRYNRFLKQMTLRKDKDGNYQMQLNRAHLRATQIGRDIIENMIEDKKITANTASKLRENLVYDEMLYIGE
ncbi:cation:proton antiporter [Bacillus testis]|uniref:cation:proton antiporter n=1 Tax=Bacillus testis TaxID=1622072 RepID=UPI00067EBFBE|nr:sodium:proton antiporter [Bacillus testis]